MPYLISFAGARLVLIFHTYTRTPKGLKFLGYPQSHSIMSMEPSMTGTKWVFPSEMPATALWRVTVEHSSQTTHSLQAWQRRLGSRTRGLLVLTQHAQEATEVSYYHRTAKDWVESRLDEIATDAGDGFDPNLALLEWQASQVQNTDIPEVLGLKENQLQSVGYFLWVWIARCFFHCPRLIDEPKNYASIVQTLDRIEEKARQVITRLQKQDHPL